LVDLFEKDTGNVKKKYLITLCTELVSEEAVVLS
jgi:hypothetical protein